MFLQYNFAAATQGVCKLPALPKPIFHANRWGLSTVIVILNKSRQLPTVGLGQATVTKESNSLLQLTLIFILR